MTPTQEAPILAHLRQDGRKRLTEISRETGIPVSTVFDRLKATTTIIRRTILLQFSTLGFTCRAILFLACSKPQKVKLGQFLCKHPYINTVHTVNNGHDFCVEGIFKDLGHLEEFIDFLEDHFTIKKPQVHYLLEELRREGFLCDPHLAIQTVEGLAKSLD